MHILIAAFPVKMSDTFVNLIRSYAKFLHTKIYFTAHLLCNACFHENLEKKNLYSQFVIKHTSCKLTFKEKIEQCWIHVLRTIDMNELSNFMKKSFQELTLSIPQVENHIELIGNHKEIIIFEIGEIEKNNQNRLISRKNYHRPTHWITKT